VSRVGSAKPALKLSGLTKRFGADTAVDAVELEVQPGQFACLVGPSGCGKTTLLRMLSGLESASAGRVEIDGQDVSTKPPAARGVGMVFQSYALFPNMTVAANIAFGMKRASRAERRARVEALLDTVGLAGFSDRWPQQLSGGQQQRVAIARALAVEPKILLLDEPLSALDPVIREQLRAELKRLQQRLGVTTVMVTHDQAEAMAVADVIAVMRAGRIEQVGDPRTLYEHPANAFVAGFLGAANRIEAEVVGAGTIRLWDALDTEADTSGWSPGAKVAAIVRPECVQLRAEGDGHAAHVVTRLFGGAATRVEAAPRACPEARILIDVAGMSDGLQAGAAVGLSFPPDRLRLYPRDAALA
jgi:ABC-type Fe3+/spermidine/putrescine transport system ATPase subunit